MQLAPLLLALAAACPPCGCRTALLARRATRQPGGALGDPVDPLATEAAAAVKPDAVGATVPGQVDLEMATTNPQLLNLATSNTSSFEAEVTKRLAVILNVPATRFSITPQSQLPALLQAKARSATAVMFTLHILPVAVPNATNGTDPNATVLVCPPCPCPTDPTPAPLMLPANSTAVLPVPQEPSAEALGSEIMLMVRTPQSIFNGVMPQTTARVPGGLFPAPEPTSVALGSRHTGPTSADEAAEINEGTRRMVAALRTQLQEANEQRAYILTHGHTMEPPEFTGKLPLPSEDTDPWSAMKDESELGRGAS